MSDEVPRAALETPLDEGPATTVRRAPWTRRHVGPLSMALAVVVLANLAWVLSQRPGRTLDIDEAGYFNISMVDYLGWKRCGVTCWWHAFTRQQVQAPLAPALASVLHVITGARVVNTMVVSAIAFGLLLCALHRCTRGWHVPARSSALLLAGGAPILLHFSRSFNFAVLAAACLAVSLAFGVMSDGFRRLGPTLGWGAAVGAMLLSRTMTISFLPGILVAAAVPVVARRSARGALHLGAGILLGFLVASTWYWSNLSGVLNYLHTFGYGARAAQFGAGRSPLSLRDWYSFLANLSSTYLQLGATAAVLLGLGLTIWTAVRGARRQHRTGGWTAVSMRVMGVLRSGSVVVTAAVIASSGIAALMSSRTNGSAFAAPLVAPLAIVASRGVEAIHGVRRQRLVACAMAVLLAPAALLSFLPIRRAVEVQALVDPPLLPPVRLTVVDSRGTLRTYTDAGGTMPPGTPDAGTTEHGREWFAASARIVDELRAQEGATHRPPVIVLAFRHRLLNPNTLGMDSLLRDHRGIPVLMLSPALPGQGAADVAAEVDPVAASVTMVITADDGPNEFTPPLPAGVGDLVVRRLSFVLLDRFLLPDGRHVSMWVPPATHA